MLVWPWQDLSPDDLHFEAVNLLSVRGIWQPYPDEVIFHPGKVLTRRELARLIARTCRSLPQAKEWPQINSRIYGDVPAADPDRAFIEAMVTWGDFAPFAETFSPDQPASWATLHAWLKRLHLPVTDGLVDGSDQGLKRADYPLTRAEAAMHLWRVLTIAGESNPELHALDRNANNTPDHLEPSN